MSGPGDAAGKVERATVVLTFESFPELEFVWISQGPRTKVGLIFVQLVDTRTRITEIPVDAILDERETIHVAEDACRLFALGYHTMKASQGKTG